LPNADRQIQLYAKQFVADNLAEAMLTCFNVDGAVGDQLDVLGKYIGVARGAIPNPPQVRPYFGLWASASTLVPSAYQGTWNPATNVPALGEGTIGHWWVVSASGASTVPLAASWQAGDVVYRSAANTFIKFIEGTPNGNGLTSSSDTSINLEGVFFRTSFLNQKNTDLTDVQYRVVLKLKIVLNSSDGTLASIMSSLYAVFPGKIGVLDGQNMTLSYFVLSTVSLSKELLAVYLPRPMGVGISVVITNPVPGGVGGVLTTEAGDLLTTESGDLITTEVI